MLILKIDAYYFLLHIAANFLYFSLYITVVLLLSSLFCISSNWLLAFKYFKWNRLDVEPNFFFKKKN
jgi:hypothetical protein